MTEHTIEDCRAAVEAWEDAQPMYLACGCLEGTHPNTIEDLLVAHPDVIYHKPTPGVRWFLSHEPRALAG